GTGSLAQPRIEAVLDGQTLHRGRQAGEYSRVVVAFRAKQHGGVRERLPLGEMLESGPHRRPPIDRNAVRSAPANLVRVGVHEGDGNPRSGQRIAHGAADAAGAVDADGARRDRWHGVDLPWRDCLRRLRLLAKPDKPQAAAERSAYLFVYSFKYPSNCWR